jgi:hypothetical protein
MAKIAPYLDVSNVKKTMDKILKTFSASDVVFERTLKDMYSRAPGKVSSAVTTVYGIKKGEIKYKKGSSKTAAGNILAKGDKLATFQLVYTGRVLTPLHFGMTPKIKPDKKKYKVKAKIKKTAKAFTPPSGGGVFLAPTGSTTIPWIRHSSDRLDISPIKTLSLPQMVDNETVREVIGKDLGELLEKRFNNHLEQHLKKNLK